VFFRRLFWRKNGADHWTETMQAMEEVTPAFFGGDSGSKCFSHNASLQPLLVECLEVTNAPRSLIDHLYPRIRAYRLRFAETRALFLVG
jgi:hypothetical protein